MLTVAQKYNNYLKKKKNFKIRVIKYNKSYCNCHITVRHSVYIYICVYIRLFLRQLHRMRKLRGEERCSSDSFDYCDDVVHSILEDFLSVLPLPPVQLV